MVAICCSALIAGGFLCQERLPRLRKCKCAPVNRSVVHGGRLQRSRENQRAGSYITVAEKGHPILPLWTHFHTSIGTSILPSALQRTTFAHAQSANVRQASTNTHEVKSWMASNRQGPIVAAATRDGLIRHYFFEGFEYRLIACFLYFVHGINISVRQIKRVLRVFNLRRKSRWNSSSIRTIRNLVATSMSYIPPCFHA